MYISQYRSIAAGCIGFMLLGACGRSSDTGETGGLGASQLSTAEAALQSGSQVPVVANYLLKLPASIGVQSAAVVAGDKLSLCPRAKVAAQIINVGSRGTELQPQAEAGGVLAESQIELAPRSLIRGNVISPLAPRLRPAASISGTDTRASIGPMREYAWSVTYPVATGDVRVSANVDRALAPGSYGEVEVAGNGILRLRAGTYYVSDLQSRPRSRVIADTAAGPVLVYVVQQAALAERIEGDAARVLLATLSSADLRLPGGFEGTVLAPNATIAAAPNAAIAGVLFGKYIQFGPGSQFTAKPFSAWEFVLPPVSKAECIIHFDATHNTAAFSYTNPLATQVTIPAGPRNLFSAGTTRTPLEVFEPGTVARAQWIPFSTPQVTWTIGGLTATADVATTPRCQSNDTPAVAVNTPLTGAGASRNWRTYGAPQVAPGGPQFDMQTPLVPNARAGVQFLQSIDLRAPTPTAPAVDADAFTFRIYEQIFGNDAACGPKRLYAKSISINGAGIPDQFWEGCINGFACGTGDPDIPLTVNVPASQLTVPVALELWEADDGFCGGGDDHILTLNLLVDRRTGLLLPGSVSRAPGEPATALAPTATRAIGEDGFGLGFRIEVQDATPARICTAWNAQFLDAGESVGSPIAEDFAGAGTAVQQIPASFAFAELRIANGQRAAYLWRGALDSQGCIPQSAAPTRGLLRLNNAATNVTLKLYAASCYDPSNNECGRQAQAPTSGALIATSLKVGKLFDLCSHWSSTSSAGVPGCSNAVGLPGWQGANSPEQINLVNPSQFEGTRIAAIASIISAAEASGAGIGITEAFVTSTRAVDPHRMVLEANDAYCLKAGGCAAYPACLEDYSCDTAAGFAGTGEPVKISGDFTRTDGRFVAGDSYVKYVVAHEIGHQIQERAMGILSLSYRDTPPNLVPPPKCACDHVGVANNLHCLQSIETAGASQVEGYAQFFAARVFNKAAEPDATFKYYKEFLADTCPANATPDNCVTQGGTGLKIISPPYAVSAVNPARWRNNNCFDNTVAATDAITRWGTEYDWMGFFYATNTQSAARSSMGDLFAVYKQACGGVSCSQREPDWVDLEVAAGTSLPTDKSDAFRANGRRFGVSRETTR